MVAPNPVRNRDFTKQLAHALKRPVLFRVPAGILTFILGDLARETILGSQNVVPEKLQSLGFEFDHAEVGPMLENITGARQRNAASGVLMSGQKGKNLA